ncbi:MAG: ATP-binding protein [Pseudomonadota bacterium]
MSFSLAQILLLTVGYLGVLFVVALMTDRGLVPERITRHPAVYVLSLGVFTGALATNGVFSLAATYGYSFLLYYAGAVLVMLLASVILMPLLRLCRVYQLSSVADVLTFRFRSERVGALVTVAMCATLLPLLALQIQAVADSVHILTGVSMTPALMDGRQDSLALTFCIIITVFAMLFGTRKASATERNTGLVSAIAFESLMKLLAMLALFYVAAFQVFDGPGPMDIWVHGNAAAEAIVSRPLQSDIARSLLLIFFAGAVCMPHLFHMAFAENTDSADLRMATWGMPLYLLLISLPVLPVLWAGMRLGVEVPVEYTPLGLGLALESRGVTLMAFFAGLSAASATIIVTTLALANMCLTHLVLPGNVLNIGNEQSLYSQLRWIRRALITLLILAGYSFFLAMRSRIPLMELGLVAFVGILQFLPGIIATLYWPRANRRGLLAGLASGLAIWFFTLALPLTSASELPALNALVGALTGYAEVTWSATVTLSLAVNSVLFIVFSLLSTTRPEEQVAAEICSMDNIGRPIRQTLTLHSAEEFAAHLAPALGVHTARSEVKRALRELQFTPEESRPYALRRLRRRIEANLSGLLGPAVAHGIINRCIPFEHAGTGSQDINLIERNLDRAQVHLIGLAADLDDMRRHYREILNNLPIGVLSAGVDGEMLMWNKSMEQITGVGADSVLGSHLASIPAPWNGVIREFLDSDEGAIVKRQVAGEEGTSRWISLQKAASETGKTGDRVVLIEDVTEFELLGEELVHSERLASVGRLAAGVAHEIGNPVTGIACLAQNLEYEDDPDEVRNTASDILKQTDRVSRIVETLVNFSHTGTGFETDQLRACNVADCVDEAIHLLRLDTQAKAVFFDNRCDRELLVQADSQRLLQIFINLLGNARDACDEHDGRVDVDAEVDGDFVAICVGDNGHGIAAEAQARVFEPFFTTKEPGEGTGLGLALVYSITEDMGGSVSLRSPVHGHGSPGTEFKLRLQQAEYDRDFSA